MCVSNIRKCDRSVAVEPFTLHKVEPVELFTVIQRKGSWVPLSKWVQERVHLPV